MGTKIKDVKDIRDTRDSVVRQAATCNTITALPCSICQKTTLDPISLDNLLQITVTATVNNVCVNKTLAIGAYTM